MVTTTEFLQRLRDNAFGGERIPARPVDLQGWMCSEFEETFARIIASFPQDKHLTIVEVGTWKGLSTSTMARMCKESSRSCTIIAVDTWLGAPEFWTWGLDDETRGGSMGLAPGSGYPSVFHTFVNNMRQLGHDDVMHPLPLPSLCARDVLAYYGIRADIVYVDAAHEYESVKTDIDAYWQMIDQGGVMFGDDYNPISWPGVCRAVDEAFSDTKRVQGVMWVSPTHG